MTASGNPLFFISLHLIRNREILQTPRWHGTGKFTKTSTFTGSGYNIPDIRLHKDHAAGGRRRTRNYYRRPSSGITSGCSSITEKINSIVRNEIKKFSDSIYPRSLINLVERSAYRKVIELFNNRRHCESALATLRSMWNRHVNPVSVGNKKL